ncbi:hypothetical protein OAM69_00160 [bacterium]|nr:hypothetical protein [bacterium]
MHGRRGYDSSGVALRLSDLGLSGLCQTPKEPNTISCSTGTEQSLPRERDAAKGLLAT